MIRRFQSLVLLFLLGCPAVGHAAEAMFTLDGAAVRLDEATNEVGVLFQAMRFNRATREWNVEVALTNTATRVIHGPFVVLIDGFSGTPGPVQPDGFDERQKPFYNMTATVSDGVLSAGGRSDLRTIVLGFKTNAVPRLVTRVYAKTSSTVEALGLTRSLNEMGQPLVDVQVLETGPKGQRTNRTDSITGVVTLGQGPGSYQWKFTSPAYLPVWRSLTLQNGEVAVLSNPRLTRRNTNSTPVTPQAGGSVGAGAGAIQVSFDLGTFSRGAVVTLTPLTAQTLPALLPLGWSPVQACWLEIADAVTHLPLGPSTASTMSLKPWGPLAAAETAVLARWSEEGLSWEVLELVSGKGTNAVTVHVPGSGAYALVAGDAGSVSPAMQLGKPLPARSSGLPAYAGLTASGTVEPAVSLASRVAELVTANATLTITNTAGPLPSGLPLRCEVKEVYRLSDGTRRFSPQYETFLVGYQRPGNQQPATLHAQFPLRPLRLFGAEELDEATLTVDVMPPTGFTGGVLGTAQGSVTVGGVRILVGPGDLTGSQAVQVRTLVAENFSGLVTGGVSTVGAFELTVTGVAPGRRLGLQWSGTPSNGVFVLARVLAEAGLYGLQPIERLASDTNGTLRSLEAGSGERLPGLNSAGQYVLTQVMDPQGLVTGAIRNAAGKLAGGLPVRITGQPWLTLSAADGSYRLVAPTGRVEVATTDLGTGDWGFAGVTVGNSQIVAKADVSAAPSGPRVAKVTPADGAASVPRVTSVVMEFSKPINPGSLGAAGIQLVDANNQPVAASLTLNLQNTIATLLPTAQLAPQSLYAIRLSASITGPAGLPLEGATAFAFTTENDALNRVGGQVTSYEPTNGIAKMEGSPGTAEPESPVILVNQTSGRTATVLSKPDGSFSNVIEAEVDDLLSAVIVNKNGTRNTIPVSRQLFRDGSVGLFSGGGILEAQSDGGPVQVIVQPGTIPSKTKFKVETQTFSEVLALLKNTPPTDATLLGGFKISSQGDELQESVDVSFPVDVDSLKLPAGARPEDASFGLAIARELDGMTVYELVDRMKYENGKLVTHSAPFLGLLSTFGSLLATPLFISVGHSLPIFGQVREVQWDEHDQIVGTPRALRGALVRINPPGGRLPQMRPGLMYTTTDSRGRYAFLVPVNSFEAEGFAMVASHIKYPGQVAMSAQALPSVFERLLIGNVLGISIDFHTQNLATIGGTPTDREPPNLRAFHSPLFPAVGNVVKVVVVATDGGSRPTIDMSVDSVSSLVEGVTVHTSDVTISASTSENVGSFGLRKTYDVIAQKPVRAVFNMTATDGSGNTNGSRYPMDFGGSDVVRTNSAPSDVNDRVGPQVVYSWPGQKATGVSPGQPLVIVFNEPIDKGILSDSTPVQLGPDEGKPTLLLSEDQRQLTVTYYRLRSDQSYTLTLSSGIKDLRNNPLDQIPDASGNNDSFVLNFKTGASRTAALSEVVFGGGAVTRGIYAYALERQGALNGALFVYDLSDPTAPQKVAQLDLPSYPRDVVLIPKYSFQRRPNGAINSQTPSTNNIETKDLLAIAGGEVTGLSEGGGGQFLWIVDISDPLHPSRVASTLLTLSTTAVVPKLSWVPPNLAYLSVEPGADSIGVINLQAFIYGKNLSVTEFRQLDYEFKPGSDKNLDGDFVDPGDSLPLPEKDGPFFPGLVDFVALGDDVQQGIVDFSMDDRGAFIGAVASAGVGVNINGVPTPGVLIPPCYRTLLYDGEPLERQPASYNFAQTDRPRRVSTFFGTKLKVNGQDALLNLALVTLNDSTLVVLDITDPLHPQKTNQLTFASEHGQIYGIQERGDGKLVLATANDLLLLDPLYLAVPQAVQADPPAALVGVIRGAGSGVRNYGMDLNGLYVVCGGGKRQVIQTAPLLQYASFIGIDPFKPADLVSAGPARMAEVFGKLRLNDSLRISQFKTNAPGVNSTLTPASSTTHYYTLVFAPGSAGETIDLSLESLNRGGYPLKSRGLLFPAVRALGTQAQNDIKQTPRGCEPPVRANKAWRLSSNPAEPNYNVYLGRPFALIYEAIKTDELDTLNQNLDRDILWSGHFLRASIDPSMNANTALGPFVGKVDTDEKVLRPGAAVVAGTFPADYVMGPNPGPIIGGVVAPAAFGSLAAHNGEITLAPIDLQLPGRRLPVEFRRAMGGQGLYEGPFGRGWDFNYNQRIVEISESLVLPGAIVSLVKRAQVAESERAEARDVMLYNGAGRVLLYKYAGTNAPLEFKNDPLVTDLNWDTKPARFYTSPIGAFNMMVKFPDGRFARLEPDGTQYWYSGQGRLEVIYDRYVNNSIHCNYNTRGDLVQILDELQRPLDIGYFRFANDPDLKAGLDESTDNAFIAGKIHRLKDFSPRDILFHYDADGILERREGPNVTVSGVDGFTGRQVTRYLMSDCSAPARTAQSITGAQSGSSSGTPLLAAADIGSTSRDVATSLQTPSGNVSLSMAHANTAEAVSNGGAKSTVTGQDGSQTEYAFDKQGRPVSIKLTGQNASAETTAFEYTTNGLVKKMTYPEGNYEEYVYDEANPNLRSRCNLLKIKKTAGSRDGADLESTSVYDPKYNLATRKKDFEGNTATLTFSSDQKEVVSVALGGGTETYGRNEFGQLASYTTADGVAYTFGYTPDGFLSTKTIGTMTTRYTYGGNAGKLGLASSVTDPNGVNTDFTYDERNQVVKQSRDGKAIENSFDERGFLTKITTTMDSGVQVVEDQTHDQLGFMLTRTVRGVEVDGAAVDLVTTFVPDAASRPTKATYPNGEVHTFSYDHLGRVVSYNVGAYGESYTYDRNGNLRTMKIGDGTESYDYDGHDRLITITTPVGGIVKYTYNGNSQPLTETVTDADDGLISSTTYTYDGRGRQKTVVRTGDSGSSTMTYDYSSGLITMTDGGGALFKTRYDSGGRVTREEKPGRNVDYTYDNADNVTKKTSTEGTATFVQQYEYNRRDQVIRVIDSLGNATRYTPGFDGRILNSTDREGKSVSNSYNSVGELLVTTPADGVEVKQAHSLNREIASVKDKNNQGVSHVYDNVGRLTTTTQADGSQTVYGNFDARNCAQTVSLPGGVTINSTFDKEGRLITRNVSGGSGGGGAETYHFDTLRRLRRVTDPSGSIEFTYDKLGYTKRIISQQNGHTYQVDQRADGAGFRTHLTYPSGTGVREIRDSVGRLAQVLPDSGAPVINNTTYAAYQLPGARQLGNDVITATTTYDPLKRPLVRRYINNTTSRILAETRYAYSKSGAQVARQFLHRGGRADFFQYDDGYRLKRADIGVRPQISSQTSRTVSGFVKPSQVMGSWAPGFFGRSFSYTDTDSLNGSSLANPDGFSVPPFAASYSLPDASVHVAVIDGFSRSRDSGGNVTRARLQVRLPSGSKPVPVDATLVYNSLGQLTRVERSDGVLLINTYGPSGLRVRRQVAGPANRCVPSDRGFVYEGANLIEERDLAAGDRLVARYYYADDGDELIAGDIWDPGTSQLERRYFLTDAVRSVLGVADASGNVMERIQYDAWGQPTIQTFDTAAPRVASVRADGGDLLIEFSESVLPILVDPPASGFAESYLAPSQIFVVSTNGQAVAGSTVYEENIPGHVFGSVFRFRPVAALTNLVRIAVNGATVVDEWNNPNPAESIVLATNVTAGAALYSGPATGSSVPTTTARSSFETTFLFQGQPFDYDAGLVYCRARFYDPAVGLFVQRDPAGYEDGVNHYAGMANNPINFRDRSGLSIDEASAWLSLVGSQASYQEDGLRGALLGGAMQAIGAVMQMGTGTAEGMDRMEHVRSGPMGVIDVKDALSLIVNDASMFAGTAASLSVSSVHSYRTHKTRINAYFKSGKEFAHDFVMQKLGIRTGYDMGGKFATEKELSCIHTALKELRAAGQEAEMTARFGFDYDKLAYRKEFVDMGVMQKRAVDKKGKSGSDAIVRKDTYGGKEVVSDIDMAGLKVNGKSATTGQFGQFERSANRQYIKSWKQEHGKSSTANPPFQHHGQFQVDEAYGHNYLGDSFDDKSLQTIGHPGHCVTFRLDGKGNLMVYRTPGWAVDIDVVKTDMRLRSRRSEAVSLLPAQADKRNSPLFMLPRNWYNWKE